MLYFNTLKIDFLKPDFNRRSGHSKWFDLKRFKQTHFFKKKRKTVKKEKKIQTQPPGAKMQGWRGKL
jgi:hypothetical protein